MFQTTSKTEIIFYSLHCYELLLVKVAFFSVLFCSPKKTKKATKKSEKKLHKLRWIICLVVRKKKSVKWSLIEQSIVET